jgi:hypothetical protein
MKLIKFYSSFVFLLVLVIFSQNSILSEKENQKKSKNRTKNNPTSDSVEDKLRNDNRDNKQNKKYEKIYNEFTESFGGGIGIRYKVKNVRIENSNNIFHSKEGGVFNITMEVLQNCPECGNAVNQILVGLAGEEKAQVCVWNGKNFSGGSVLTVNADSEYEALAEDNEYPEWVEVFFQIKIPNKKGEYYIRTRYAQDYIGNLLTKEGLKIKQKSPKNALGWWKVDRPNGPDSGSNIGLIVIE